MTTNGPELYNLMIHLRGANCYEPAIDWQCKRRARGHYEMYVIHTGSMQIDCAGRSCQLTNTMATIVPPGEPFRDAQGEHVTATKAIIIGFDVITNGNRDPLSLLGLPVPVTWRRPGLQRQLALRCARLAPYSGSTTHNHLEATGLAHALTMAYLAAGEAHNRFAKSDRELPDWLVGLLHELDEGFGRRTWSVSDMAAAAGLSASRFAHVFKEHLGVPPKTWLRHRALIRASQLIRQHPEWSIARIARDCGWRDPDEFSRRFRAAFGHSPSSR